MKTQTNKTSAPAKGMKKQSDEHQARLAKALRTNLQRRKASSRAPSPRSNAQGD